MANRTYPPVDGAGNIQPDRHQESLTPLQAQAAEKLAKTGKLDSVGSIGMSKEMLLRSFMDDRFCRLVEEKHQEEIDFTLRAAIEASQRFALLPDKKSADRTLAARLDHKIADLTHRKNAKLLQRYPELRIMMPPSFLRRYE